VVGTVTGRGQLDGVRTLVIGASSGIGRAFALAAHEQGARIAVAARRDELLTQLAGEVGGSAHHLDVSDMRAVATVVHDVAEQFGGIDAIVFTSVVVPLARVEHVEAATWMNAFAVNAIGPAMVIREALPHLSDDAVIVVASSHDVGRPRAGVSAYSASKAALNEIIASWRREHPFLRVVRVAVGPTDDTEILRGADQDLLAELFGVWELHGQSHPATSRAADVAGTLVSLIHAARTNPSVVTEVVKLAPAASKGP
jgi:NAD(P)-dependent dehydrogenase (short-subunit alcohol dehydrogenase family)